METKRDSYYDFDVEIEEVLIKNGMIADMFYLKDLKQRKLFLNDEINSFTVEDAVKHIMQINREDVGKPYEERTPILVYVNSNGGSVDAGFQLIDVILSSKTPVYTINTGYQYSMGFLIGLSGHKRFATLNAKYLMHDGTNFILNSGSKARDQMAFQDRVEDRIKQYVLSRSKVTSEEYDAKMRIEWYMFADEAKKEGFVDYIVGIDCDIDSIV